MLFYLEEKYMSSFGKVYANQLSVGILRAIAVIAALLEEKEESLVIIDEVDNGLHTRETFESILEKNMLPVYDSAKRQGYEIWNL